MPSDESLDLQREYRQIVLQKLSSLETGQKALEEKLAVILVNAVRMDEFKGLSERVRALEELKLKAIGAWVVVQGISVFIVWVVSALRH